jgi:hypothetical protein
MAGSPDVFPEPSIRFNDAYRRRRGLSGTKVIYGLNDLCQG